MIFGIKTKKDKLIEELKAKNEFLIVENKSLRETRPRIVYSENNIETLEASYMIDMFDAEYINTERIKEFMLRDMCKALTPYLEIKQCEDYMRRQLIFKGRLRVVTGRR